MDSYKAIKEVADWVRGIGTIAAENHALTLDLIGVEIKEMEERIETLERIVEAVPDGALVDEPEDPRDNLIEWFWLYWDGDETFVDEDVLRAVPYDELSSKLSELQGYDSRSARWYEIESQYKDWAIEYGDLCPDCEGDGEITDLSYTHEIRIWNCPTCKGTGHVSKEEKDA